MNKHNRNQNLVVFFYEKADDADFYSLGLLGTSVLVCRRVLVWSWSEIESVFFLSASISSSSFSLKEDFSMSSLMRLRVLELS